MKKITTRKGRLENKIRLELSKETPSVGKILDATDAFEKNNIDTINKLKKLKRIDTKRINGALKQTINAHGPITKLLIGSASKRIYEALISGKEKKQRISIKNIIIGFGASSVLYILYHLIF